MLPQIKEDIAKVLEQTIKAVKAGDAQTVSELSNHTIHNASVFQDSDSLETAILVYALAKMLQRCCEQGINYSRVIPLLQNAKSNLMQDDEEGYRKSVKKLFETIKQLDSRMKLFVQEVIIKAQIKKGSKLHEHGLSIGRTAELLGISQWDLMSYVGLQEHEPLPGVNVKERLKTARRLFGI